MNKHIFLYPGNESQTVCGCFGSKWRGEGVGAEKNKVNKGGGGGADEVKLREVGGWPIPIGSREAL